MSDLDTFYELRSYGVDPITALSAAFSNGPLPAWVTAATATDKAKLADIQKMTGGGAGVSLSLKDVLDNPNMSTQDLANLGIIRYWQNEIPSMSIMSAVQNGTAKLVYKPEDTSSWGNWDGGVETVTTPAHYVLQDPKTGVELPVNRSAQNPNAFTFSTYNPTAGGYLSGVVAADEKTGQVAPLFDAAKQFAYSPGSSSGGFFKSIIADLGPILPIAAIAFPELAPITSALSAVNAVQSGNPLAALAAATGIPGVSDAIGAGAASALQTANQANNLVHAVESDNLLGALTSGANLTGTGGTQLGDTGYTVADALKTANIVSAAEQGNAAPLLNALAKQSSVQGPSASDMEAESFAPVSDTFNPADYGLVDLSAQEQEAPYTPTTDYSFTPNYSLAPDTAQLETDMGGAQGVQAPELPDVFTPSDEVDYSLFMPTETGGESALQMPETPNLDFMGGGQGLTIPVDGGTLTEAGIIPDNYTAPLGDTTSFINQPAPDSGVDIAALQKQWAEQAAAQQASAQQAADKAAAAQKAQNTALQKQLAQQNSNQSLMNMLLLAGLSDASQQPQQAVQTPVADIKSFEDLGFGDLFGSKLKFSDGGNVEDLLNLLRG